MLFFSSYLFPIDLHHLYFCTENYFIKDSSEKVLSSTFSCPVRMCFGKSYAFLFRDFSQTWLPSRYMRFQSKISEQAVALPMSCVLSYYVVCCLVYCWTIVLIHSSNMLIRESRSDKENKTWRRGGYIRLRCDVTMAATRRCRTVLVLIIDCSATAGIWL